MNHATADGTRRYAERFAREVAVGHFRALFDVVVSSVGQGTYLGGHDDVTDASYREATKAALIAGCNVVDTAINYRFQRSERCVGAAVRELIGVGAIRRDEVVIASKGGYLPFDGSPPHDPAAWFTDTFVKAGVASADDVVAGCHVMSPGYLRHQLAQSLRNLCVECVDVYYLHNPETQLGEIDRAAFNHRLALAFEALEDEGGRGRLRWYGVATWNGLRQDPGTEEHLSLSEMVRIAEQVAGAQHRFRVIQLPYNIAMPEALLARTQMVEGEQMSCLEAAQRLGLGVMASGSIMQGHLSRTMPNRLRDSLAGLRTDAQRAIQFVRSTPGVTTALVGMRSAAHVTENLEVRRVPPLAVPAFQRLLARE